MSIHLTSIAYASFLLWPGACWGQGWRNPQALVS